MQLADIGGVSPRDIFVVQMHLIIFRIAVQPVDVAPLRDAIIRAGGEAVGIDEPVPVGKPHGLEIAHLHDSGIGKAFVGENQRIRRGDTLRNGDQIQLLLCRIAQDEAVLTLFIEPEQPPGMHLDLHRSSGAVIGRGCDGRKQQSLIAAYLGMNAFGGSLHHISRHIPGGAVGQAQLSVVPVFKGDGAEMMLVAVDHGFRVALRQSQRIPVDLLHRSHAPVQKHDHAAILMGCDPDLRASHDRANGTDRQQGDHRRGKENPSDKCAGAFDRCVIQILKQLVAQIRKGFKEFFSLHIRYPSCSRCCFSRLRSRCSILVTRLTEHFCVDAITGIVSPR